MRLYFFTVLCSAALLACGGRGAEKKDFGGNSNTDAPSRNLIAGVLPQAGTKCKAGDAVELKVELAAGVTADSVAFHIAGSRVVPGGTSLRYDIGASTPVGKLSWHATAYSGADSTVRYGEITVLASAAPRKYGFKVLKSYPHNTNSYTQGLLWHDGFLYESTGLEGQSAVMKVDLQTGRTVQRRDIDAKYFGEGLALLGGMLYQLTWQNNMAMVYDLESLRPAGQFGYSGEGWGLATDGRMLYMSDGTENIYIVDPASFKTVRTLQVYTDTGPLPYINEMEWIEGEIWANIYTTSLIARIDPATGAVKGLIDLTGILPVQEITQDTEVMNGIAYDGEAKRIFVTGKNWSKLFEIEVTAK